MNDNAFYYDTHVHVNQNNGFWSVVPVGKFDTRAVAFIAAARVAIQNKRPGDEITFTAGDGRFKIAIIDKDFNVTLRIYSTRIWR